MRDVRQLRSISWRAFEALTPTEQRDVALLFGMRPAELRVELQPSPHGAGAGETAQSASVSGLSERRSPTARQPVALGGEQLDDAGRRGRGPSIYAEAECLDADCICHLSADNEGRL